MYLYLLPDHAVILVSMVMISVQLLRSDLSEVVSGFETKHNPQDRYASFDYAFNYFHPTGRHNLLCDMEKSCLSLGFYLASWGMFRGSSFMLEKSSKIFVPIIEYIAKSPTDSWEIDVDQYNQENIDFLIEQYNHIKELLIPGGQAHLTLITKIMLGVFASVPAYDRFFIKSFSEIFKGRCGFSSFNKKSLNCIGEFYLENKEAIDEINSSMRTVSFMSGEKTELSYTRAKIIDMYGFTKGL